MAEFEYSQDPDPQWNDRCFLTVDERYTMSMVRTHKGLDIDIWPINEGKVWDMPCMMIEILDADTAVDPHEAERVANASMQQMHEAMEPLENNELPQ